MFAEKHYPESLNPEELDAYLSKGWYRMGQSIFTTHFLCFDQQFYSAIWVRQDLEGFGFGKRPRKLMRNNDRLFRHEIHQGKIDQVKERLYQRYRRSFPGILAPTLKDSLLDGEEINIYNTFEVCIYDGDQLVAFSFFDLGADSSASILGVYDPDYRQYSLGFYSMLLEMEYSVSLGLKYYYPGYVVPGYSRFEYKLRIGPVEYFHMETGEWLPYAAIKEEDIPIEKMREKLKAVQQKLSGSKLYCRVQYYPLFEASLFSFWRANYLDFPIVLNCTPENRDRPLLVVFDTKHDHYSLVQCSNFDDPNIVFNEGYLNNFSPTRFLTSLMVVNAFWAASDNPQEVAETLLDNLQREQG